MTLLLRLLALITLLLSALHAQAQRFELGQLQGELPSANHVVKVAFFDADLTLRNTTTPGMFTPQNPQDQIIFPGVAEQIRQLNEAGYVIAVLSNQGRVSTPQDWENQRLIFESMKERLAAKGAVINYVNIDGAQHPENRKPKLGMYHLFERALAERGLKLDSLSSFFVGDAAYTTRENPAVPGIEVPRDFTNFDREFARNAGLPFFHADEFFSRRPSRLPGMDMSWLKLQLWLNGQQQKFAQLENQLDLNDARSSIEKLQQAQEKFLIELTVQVAPEIEKLILSHSNSRQWEQIRPLLQNLKNAQLTGNRTETLESFQRLLDKSSISSQASPNLFRRWLDLCRRWWIQALEYRHTRHAEKSLLTNADYILGQKRFAKTVQDLQERKWLPRQTEGLRCSGILR